VDNVHFGIDTGLSVLFYNAGEAADLSIKAGLGDPSHAFKLTFGGYRKASLDDIHSEFVKLPGDLDLLLLGE